MWGLKLKQLGGALFKKKKQIKNVKLGMGLSRGLACKRGPGAEVPLTLWAICPCSPAGTGSALPRSLLLFVSKCFKLCIFPSCLLHVYENLRIEQ